MSDDSWRNAQLEPAEEPRAWGIARRTWLRLFASAVMVACGAVFFISTHRIGVRCHQECYGAPPRSDYGSRSYEPGHPWTEYSSSWQWTAQHVLAIVALVAAAIALILAFGWGRRPRPALIVAGVALSSWTAWALLSPPIP